MTILDWGFMFMSDQIRWVSFFFFEVLNKTLKKSYGRMITSLPEPLMLDHH